MNRSMLLLMVVCGVVVGCGKNPTQPLTSTRIIVNGTIVNATDTTFDKVVVNNTTVATNFTPGSTVSVDLGTGPSDFYTRSTATNCERSFERYISYPGTVSYKEYQRRGWIWAVGRGFYTPTFKEDNGAKY